MHAPWYPPSHHPPHPHPHPLASHPAAGARGRRGQQRPGHQHAHPAAHQQPGAGGGHCGWVGWNEWERCGVWCPWKGAATPCSAGAGAGMGQRTWLCQANPGPAGRERAPGCCAGCRVPTRIIRCTSAPARCCRRVPALPAVHRRPSDQEPAARAARPARRRGGPGDY